MEQYVALDISLQKIAVCVLNASGRVVIEAEVASEPGDWSLMIDGMCAARTC